MAEDHRPGAVYWIDHYVVPTNDLPRHLDFMSNVLGAQPAHRLGLTTQAVQRYTPLGAFSKVGHYHSCGSFLQDHMLPEPSEVGKGTPRYGYYVRRADIDEHLRRLDDNGCPHTDPQEISDGGDEGTVVYFMDPDGNQYEFWAPRHMPPAAMEADNPVRIGRISHFVFESRDLDRTVDFYGKYCGIEQIRNADIPKDRVAFRLEGGGRMVFHRVSELNPRTGGHNLWKGQHAALAVRNDEFRGAYERLWSDLSESTYQRYTGVAAPDESNLPARTETHGVVARGERTTNAPRGTSFYDWDTNCFHFMGGAPRDRAFNQYEPHTMDWHLPTFLAKQGTALTK